MCFPDPVTMEVHHPVFSHEIHTAAHQFPHISGIFAPVDEQCFPADHIAENAPVQTQFHGDLGIGKTHLQRLFRTVSPRPQETMRSFSGIDIMRLITEIRCQYAPVTFHFNGRFPVVPASGTTPFQRSGMKAAGRIILPVQQGASPSHTVGDIPVCRILLAESRSVIVMFQMSRFRHFKEISGGSRMDLKP